MQDPGSPTPPVRALVVSSDPDRSQALTRALTDIFGYEARTVLPADVAALDAALAEGIDALVYHVGSVGLGPLQSLLETKHVAAVVLLDRFDPDLLAMLAGLPVHACLLEPVSPEQAGVALKVALVRQRAEAQLASENERLQLALNNRKLIERAKGLLMKRHRWSEPEAFRRLQRGAMNRRVPMVDLARQVLEGADVPL